MTAAEQGQDARPALDPSAVLLVHGVAWVRRRAHLSTTGVEDGVRTLLPLRGRRLGFVTVDAGPFCTGWYGFDAEGGRLLPCPDRAPATSSGQCADCALRDQFRFVHHGHTGGYVPAALERVLAAPHWLYLATFADGYAKIGTAAAHRKQERIDEQGAVLASYVAHAVDGRIVREAEDLVTAELQVPQHRRRAAKVAALVQPAPRARVSARHDETVAQVSALLRRAGLGSGLDPVQEAWVPPGDLGVLAHEPPQGSWVPYPSDLGRGPHGLQVEACAGPAVLARTRSGPDATRHLADLGRLRGRRIVLADVESPDVEVQEPLF